MFFLICIHGCSRAPIRRFSPSLRTKWRLYWLIDWMIMSVNIIVTNLKDSALTIAQTWGSVDELRGWVAKKQTDTLAGFFFSPSRILQIMTSIKTSLIIEIKSFSEIEEIAPGYWDGVAWKTANLVPQSICFYNYKRGTRSLFDCFSDELLFNCDNNHFLCGLLLNGTRAFETIWHEAF